MYKRQHYKLEAILPLCVHESVKEGTFDRITNLPYQIVEEGNRGLLKRLVDKYKLFRNIGVADVYKRQALPMSLQQATGITYDNFTYMILFLVLALVLKIYYEGINRKTGISLALLCMALSLCKGGVYTPMLFLVLCIPKEKMGNIKKKIIYILVMGGLTLLLFLVSYSLSLIHIL